MNVYQLVYTKTEESPWNKAGFHTAFYSTSLLDANHLSEIESRIHWPQETESKPSGKQTVFYWNLRGKEYLCILTFRNLPEAKDRFGRGGIFLCHGFLFPPELWRRIPSPLDAFSLVKDSVFSNREEMIASPLIDKTTGNFHPIEIPERKLESIPEEITVPNEEFRRRLVLLLYKFSRAGQNRFPIVIIGPHQETSLLMNQTIACLPDVLKVNIGWDSAMDGGRLGQFPLKIAGYSRKPPSSEGIVQIDIERGAIEMNRQPQNLLEPESPYEKWICHSTELKRTKSSLETVYLYSQFLENDGAPPSRDSLEQLPSDFTTINEEIIRSVFRKSCSRRMDSALSEQLTLFLTPEELLEHLVLDFETTRLSESVQRVIIQESLGPSKGIRSISSSLLESGSPLLRPISRLWENGRLSTKELSDLDTSLINELMSYCIRSEIGKSDFLIEMFRRHRELLGEFLRSKSTAAATRGFILKTIETSGKYRGLEDLLLLEAQRQNKSLELLCGESNIAELLEPLLQSHDKWEESQIKALLEWSQSNSPPAPGRFPYVSAFLFPVRGMKKPAINGKDRNRLIEWLLRYWKFRPRDLLESGFSENDVKKILRRLDAQKSKFEKITDFLLRRNLII